MLNGGAQFSRNDKVPLPLAESTATLPSGCEDVCNLIKASTETFQLQQQQQSDETPPSATGGFHPGSG